MGSRLASVKGCLWGQRTRVRLWRLTVSGLCRAQDHKWGAGAPVLTEAWLPPSRCFSGGRTNPVGGRPVDDPSIPERRIQVSKEQSPPGNVNLWETPAGVSWPTPKAP